MAKPIIDVPHKESFILWQIVEEGVGEPAILVEKFSDCFRLSQEGRWINLNFETVNDLFRHIKARNV